MRITEEQKNVIVEAVKNNDPAARVWLFGSRADDSKKGGDIDIAILSETIHEDVMQTIQVRRFICDRIGEQKIDIVTSSDGQEVFFRMAREKGIELNMKNTSIEILRKNIEILNLSANWVNKSYEQCKTIEPKNDYSEEEFNRLENLTSRYARTTDMLVNKVLRSIDTVEMEDSGTLIDVMNRAEKREIVKSSELLHTIKNLRNNIVHEYQITEITKFFTDVQKYSPILLEIIKKVNNYSAKYLEKTDE